METINVIFYGYSDDQDYVNDLSVNIADRFNIDYPDSNMNIEIDEDEEEFSITFEVNLNNIENADTFLCEEICQEHEVYCKIVDNQSSKEYFFDEEDEWIYK